MLKYKKIHNILLVKPFRPSFSTVTGKEYPFPLGLGYLAAVLNKNGYEVTILDLDIEPLNTSQIAQKISDLKPDVVGTSSMFTEIRKSHNQVTELVKKVNPEIITVVGGVHPTVMPELALEEDRHTDFVILGEGEETIIELLEGLNGKKDIGKINGIGYRENGHIKIRPQQKIIEDLDKLPFPAWELFPYKKYFYTSRRYFWKPRNFPYSQMITSRGCPGRCTFCSTRRISPAYRLRSAQNVLEEIEILHKNYAIKEIMFYDDNLTSNHKRMKEICRGLLNKGLKINWFPAALAIYSLDEELLELMKESGCYRFTLAIESGVDSVLKNIIHKPITTKLVEKIVNKSRELNMEVVGLFIIGLPGETKKDIMATVDFAEKLDLDYFILSIATPYPGTQLYEFCLENNYLIPDFSLDKLGVNHGCIVTPEFKPLDLEIIRRREWLRINFSNIEKKKRLSNLTGLSPEEVEAWQREEEKNLEALLKKGAL